MIKLVAFDWNGTLLSDTWAAVKASNAAATAFGHNPISVKQYQKTFVMPIVKYWTRSGFKKSVFRKNATGISDIFSSHYEPLANKCGTRSGSKSLLKFLKSKKIERIIYSNHSVPNIHRQLVRLKIDKHITKILAREERDRSHLHKKSKERKLIEYIRQHGYKHPEMISVGDTEEEIEIGKKFGFHTVAITGGYNTTARLKKHRPDFLIHNMIELVGIIKKLNNPPHPNPLLPRRKGRKSEKDMLQ